MSIEDALRTRPKATGDDHFAVLLERFANRIEGFVDRGVDESAGVDDHEICGIVVAGDGITLSPQLSEDTFRIDERFGAA
jgi:hypothetical protein